LLLDMIAFPFLIAIILVGALNWLTIGVLKVNVLEKIFGVKSMIPRILYVLVGISALAIVFNRDTYLPFLGQTVVPCSLIPEKIPEGADTTVQVKVKPGAKVLYWAAEPASDGLKKLNDWRGAYLKFMNAGVVTANKDGVATLYVKNPQPYTVPWKGRLEPHVHFRMCGSNGMMERIETVYMADGRVEAFTGSE
jgi:uncharacterized membrane protein YuzA (DUF378 family)